PSISKLGSVAATGKAVAMGGSWASSAGRFTRMIGTVAAKAPNLAGFVGTVASQAALGGEIYLLTGLAMDGIGGYNSGKELSFDSVWGNYSQGLLIGGVSGAAFGGAAWAANSKIGSQIGAKITGSRLGQALIKSKAGQFVAASPKLLKVLSVTGRLAVPTVGGALVFPAAKTIIGGDVSLKGFADSYSNPWNYVTGGIIGLGLGIGYTSIPKVPLSGVLKAPLEGATAGAFKLGLKRFILGGVVANAAGTGVNLLKGNYRDENNTFNWNRLGIDAATNFAIGGLTALYVGKQGTNIVKGLQNYAGPMGGNNLYNVAVRGAAEWVIISPAFTVGGGLWEGVKAKAGYYGNGLSADSQNLVNNMSWDPRTWVLIKGNYTEEEGKMKLNLASLTGTDLLLSAVEGPRSGMWMKPLISLAQVQTEQPGLIGRSLDKIGEKITAGPKAAFGKLSISHPGLAKALTYVQKGASWTYSSVIRMPGIVTAIDTGVGMIDDQMLKLANPGVALDDPKLYRQAEDSKGNIISGQFTRGYMSKGMREYAKWLPFFMMPVRIPKNPTSNKLSESGKDMSEALKVLGLKSGASADEMKLAYRDLARSMHPDVNPNNPLANAQMSEINGAYAFLTGKTNSFSRANYNTTAAPSKNTNFNGTYPISNAGETRIVVYDPVFARTQIELSQGRMPTIWQPQQVNVVQAAKTTPVQPAVSALPIVTKVSVSTSLTVYDPIFARTQIELSQGRIPTAWRMQNNVVSNQLNSLNQSIINGVNNLRNNPAAIPMFVTRGLKSFLAQEGLSEQEINGLSAEQAWARADGILTAKGVIEPIKSQPMQQQPAPLAQPTVTISTGVPVSSIGNVEINAAVKQAEINLGIARGESAFTARPEQRSTSTDILLNAVKGEDMMYTQSTSGGKTKVIIPMTETATVLLGGKAVRVVPTDTGLETLRTDPVMQKLAPDRIIISQEDMNLGLSQDPARFIASIENSNQIAISQTTLGFLENQASLGDVNSQRAVNALLHKDFKGMKVMIHDEAQYATPPTIIGEQPKSVKESHPAVYKVSKEVGTVIFSTLKLSEKDFASEIKDQSDNLHKTGDFEVRRFDAPVMDKIAKELIGPKATANSLSQDQLHAINTAAELIPTKRGTDHDYTVDKGIIEMTQGEDRSSTNPSDPYFAAMRQQLYLHRYGIEVADDLIVTSPRGNQVGYSRVLNDFRKAGWSIPGLTATPQARKAAWEYGISIDV
ncbi:MAG: J domain-containing protein, partial [Candidatus Omnitrophica bacterium]|nr:J domain-containing protein [Candidatus Omnitrophota bacterium]